MKNETRKPVSFSQNGDGQENPQSLNSLEQSNWIRGSFPHKKDSSLYAVEDYAVPMRPVSQHPYLLGSTEVHFVCTPRGRGSLEPIGLPHAPVIPVSGHCRVIILSKANLLKDGFN